MDVILYFVLREFVLIPSKRNVFVSLQLDFSSAKFIGSSHVVLSHFVLRCSELCILICSALPVSLRAVQYYITYYFRRGIFNLFSRFWRIIILALFREFVLYYFVAFLFFFCVIFLFFYLINILITYMFLHFLFKLFHRRFVKNWKYIYIICIYIYTILYNSII